MAEGASVNSTHCVLNPKAIVNSSRLPVFWAAVDLWRTRLRMDLPVLAVVSHNSMQPPIVVFSLLAQVPLLPNWSPLQAWASRPLHQRSLTCQAYWYTIDSDVWVSGPRQSFDWRIELHRQVSPFQSRLLYRRCEVGVPLLLHWRPNLEGWSRMAGCTL